MKRTFLFSIFLAMISMVGYSQDYVGATFTIKDAWDNVLRSNDLNRRYELIGTYRGWDTTAVYIAGYNKSNSSYTTQKVYFGTPYGSNSHLLFNLMTGCLGIGTTNPTSKLVISDGYNGVSFSVGTVSGIGFNRNATDGAIYNSNISGWQLTSRDERFSIEGYNGASYSPFNILKNGNVLIGKTTQDNTTYKLDVAGKVRADEITVNTSGADFVFENGYNLRPLTEVEAFVKANRHLPDVAPASEMQENGVSIGDMNAKLLQKVEELTLYSIAQEKVSTELKQNLAKQEMLSSELQREIKELRELVKGKNK